MRDVDAIEVTAADAAAWDAAVNSFRKTRRDGCPELTLSVMADGVQGQPLAPLRDSTDGLAGIGALRWSEQ